MLTESFKKDFPNSFPRIINFLIWMKIKPNGLTTMGVMFGLLAGFLFAYGYFLLGGLAIFWGGFCDIFDGVLARHFEETTQFGRFYDSVMDRYSELAIFIGLSFYYSHQSGMVFQQIAADLSLAGSILVSYTKARAEGLGEVCNVGFMQRPERIILIILGTVLTGLFKNQLFATIALVIIAFSSNITAIQRILHIRKKIRPPKI